MKVLIRLVCLAVVSCILSACNLRPAIRANEGTLQPKTETIEETIPSEIAVEFEGVSFSYDLRVFGNVTQEIVPEHELEQADYKPDSVAPEHIRFEFEFGREYSKARVEVYPLDGFPKVYSVNPALVEYMKKEIDALRKVIKNPSHRADGHIPRLPYEDVGISFYEEVRKFDFQNGDGVIFITHWTHGIDFISNTNLLYRFEGITADGRYYVTAQTPISVAFLPDSSPTEFEGFTEKDLIVRDSKAEAKYKAYVKSITTRLEKLDPGEFSPPLDKFEQMVKSVRVTK